MKNFNSGPSLLIDARCLQDPSYRTRGVGRHASNLLNHARSFLPDGSRIVALTDRLSDPLWPIHAELFDAVRTTAHASLRDWPDYFVQLSPMTHSPMPAASVLVKPKLVKAAVVYDFIPDQDPTRYFPTASLRIAYELARLWLEEYDAFFPISQSSSQDLLPFISGRQRIEVTGAPVDERFESAADGGDSPKTHILAVGGGDPRKNVQCAVEAHAISARLNDRRIPLVITGRYQASIAADLQALHEAKGGNPELLQLRSEVDDEELVRLYRSSYCVVVPSLAEGFSLPVVEGMASGAPIVASRIPAHQELITADASLCEPTDAREFSRKIDAVCFDAEEREQVLSLQEGGWERFRGEQVAKVFWTTLLETGSGVSAPGISRNARPKVAFLSPLPPDPSGVADYSAASLTEIGRLCDVHAYSETENPASLKGVTATLPLTDFPFLASTYDQVVGVVGNSHFHRGIFERLLDYGGACIEHDNRLLGFYCGVLGWDHALSQAGRELGREVTSQELESWLHDESLLTTDFLGELAHACQPIFFHSAVTAKKVQERHGVEAKHLPFCIYRPWSSDRLTLDARARARVALGFSPSDLILASFGLGAHTKGLQESLWTLDLLRSWGVPAKLALVGGVEHGEFQIITSLCSELGLSEHVRFVGGSGMAFVGEELYQAYLQAADIGIQLRTFGQGGLSGALLDCISAGLPTVTTDDLASTMEAPSYVARVPNHLSPVLIAEAALSLTDRRQHDSRNREEREHYYAAHNFGLYAELLCEGLGFDLNLSLAR